MVERSCKVCAKPVNRKNPGLQCGSFCGRFYHGLCINIVGNMLDNLRSEGVMWTCLDCRNSRKSVGESTIPRSSHNTSDSASHALVEIREELAKIRESQAALLQSVEFCSHKISEFEREIKKLNEYTRKTDQLSEENKNMRLEMDDLHARIDDLEQVSRLNNIEIQGVPEKKGEDLHRLVEEMGEQMDCTLVTSTIDYVHRVQLNQNTAKNKIKNIIIKFNSRKERDRFLLAARTKRIRNGHSSRLSFEGISDDVYINEHLTLANKILFKEARETAKTKLYKYVWIKNGVIFCRKTDSSRIFTIRDRGSLERM